MKKLILSISFALFIAITFAHPPKNIIAKYDQDSKMLTISVIHNVKNENTHFVDKIVVKKNDILVK